MIIIMYRYIIQTYFYDNTFGSIADVKPNCANSDGDFPSANP